MSKARYVFACALLIPLLGAATPTMAQTQTQGQAAPKDSAETAKRTKCFEQAQAAVQALGPSAQSPKGMKEVQTLTTNVH